MSRSDPRLLRGTLVASLAYLATTWACVWLLKHPLAEAATGVRALVGLAPIVPIAFAVRSVVRLVLDGDELQRRIDLESIAVAALATGLGALTLSLLVGARVVEVSARSALVWVFPALFLTYAVARIWAGARYR